MPFRQKDFAAIRKLVHELWLVTDNLAHCQLRSYREHVRECRKATDDLSIPIEKISDILKLCAEVNDSILLTLDEVYDKLALVNTAIPGQKKIEDRSIQQAITFVTKLCHFVHLGSELRKGTKSTLKQILRDSLAACTSTGPDRLLKEDFCEKNLTRRTSIKLRYTSNLLQHLELQGNQLFVFRHGTVLKAYAEDSGM